MKVAMPIIGDINRLTGGYLYQKRLAEYLGNRGVEVDVITLWDMPYPLYLLANFWLLFHLMGKNYDLIIEDEMVHPALWLFNFWARRKAKVVAIVHLLHWIMVKGSWQAPFIKFMEKLMLQSAHLIIANSKHTKEELEKMGLHREGIEVVYPGFNIPFMLEGEHRQGDAIKLLFVGLCCPRKGLDLLVEAIHHLDNPRITLDIVGDENVDPKYTQRVKKMVTNWELKDRVRFHGKIEQESIGGFYSTADIFVLPSLYEPFGIVLAEAMSFGLPIIATSVGGVPEIVEHQKNGLLVPPQDVYSLAQAIDKLASEAELRERFGRASCEKSKRLNTWEDCCKAIFEHLQRFEA